jgi:hypothetical protein
MDELKWRVETNVKDFQGVISTQNDEIKGRNITDRGPGGPPGR